MTLARRITIRLAVAIVVAAACIGAVALATDLWDWLVIPDRGVMG